MNQDLKIIKKKYGEEMAKLCREFFPTLLETEGLLPKLLLNTFEPNHSLYKDIIAQEQETEFKNYIYSLVNVENNNQVKTNKTPKELLNEVGYELYECKSEKEIQSFKKYYSKGEELCTFHGGRLNRCRVFFAVKKDVDKIRRKDYKNPQRQDEYGTSVISIQFTRDSSHTLSIKNRYNHRVNNPDSTFSNNLDNIVEGLTKSFEKEYGLIQHHKNRNLEIEGYVRAADGKYYKYNQEINNVYYCLNNIIIDNFEVKKYEKEKYIVVNYFILDLVNKEIKIYDKKVEDSFPDTIKDIEKIEIENVAGKEKNIKIKVKDGEDIRIVLNEDNQIIKLINSNVEKVGHWFLRNNNSLEILDLPNLQEVGDDFLYHNSSLQEINLPKLQKVGNSFLYQNNSLQTLSLPNLQKIGDWFLSSNNTLQTLSLPNLPKTGDWFLKDNNSLQTINLPNLLEATHSFLSRNNSLKEVSLPNLEKVDDSFLWWNTSLQMLDLPNLEEVGSCFLYHNSSLQEINLPKLQKVGYDFLYHNSSLQEINLPKLQKVGSNFLYHNSSLQEINLPKLRKVGSDFLYSHPAFNENNFKDSSIRH